MNAEELERLADEGKLRPVAPGGPEWQERLDIYLADDRPQVHWWLSFTDPDRPKGDQFLGLCIVPGANIIQAGQVAWALGCNPGGQVAGWPLPERFRPEFVGRLYAGEEGKLFADVPIEERT